MKKAVVLIAALLMVGSLAFAMTPSFGIWGRTLFTVAGGTSRTGFDGIYQGLGPNWDGNGPRLGLHTTFTTEKVEFKLVLYFNGAQTGKASADYGGNQNLQVMSAFGTIKFIPDLLTVYVGKNNGDGWDFFRYETSATANNINNGNCGRMNGWGLLVAVAPKDSGLTVVGQWKLPNPTGFDYWGGVAPVYATSNTIGEMAKNANIGVSYQIPDIAKIVLAYVTDPSGGNILGNPGEDNKLAPFVEPDHNVLLRAHLLMVPNLTLVVEGKVWGLNIEGADLSFKAQLFAAYTLDALWIGLGAEFQMVGGGATSYGAYLEAKYNLGAVTVALAGNFIDTNTEVDGFRIKIMPWVLLNDFNTRIAFEYYIHNTETSDQDSWWAIPIYFTFSIW